jgi:predicted nucleic acid-binding protein
VAIVLFDTNILIDYLKGYPPAIVEVEYWENACISAITWIEVMAGAKIDEQDVIAGFLAGFVVIHTDDAIMKSSTELRRTSIEIKPKVAVPDTIIMSTGLIRAQMIITRNRRDFKLAEHLHGHVRTPYELTDTDPVGFKNVIPPPGPLPDRDQDLPVWEEF